MTTAQFKSLRKGDKVYSRCTGNSKHIPLGEICDILNVHHSYTEGIVEIYYQGGVYSINYGHLLIKNPIKDDYEIF